MTTRFWIVGIVVVAAAATAGPSWARRQSIWMASWTASPTLPLAASPNVPKAALARSFENQTVSQVVRLSAGGTGVRLRLSNEYGATPLRIGAAVVTLVDRDGMVVPDTERRVTFAGSASALIPAGAPWTSDAIDLSVPVRARLRVRLFFPDNTGLCTCHPAGGQTATVSPQGDFTAAPFEPIGTFTARAFISSVEVRMKRAAPVIVTFGDSITDGYLSTNDADRRWPDRLAERLAGNRATRDYGVANAGIAGNRLLEDGAIKLFGQSALARFDRDVLSVPGVQTVIVLEGINDIGRGLDHPVPASTIIAAYLQIIDRAHAKGIKVIGGTLLPYEKSAYFRRSGNIVRRSVNHWILHGGAFDDVIDFDAVMRDPAHTDRLRADLQSGDWLHPNDSGYWVMGNTVSLHSVR